MNAISASTYSTLFKKGSESNISSFSIQDAAIIVSTDTHKVFLDMEQNTRIEVSDFIKGYTSNQIIAKSAGALYLNKVYIASDTGHLYMYRYDIEEETNVAVDITNFKVSEASHADSATSATVATNASSAEYATNASSADYASSAGTASQATNADTAAYATNAGSAQYASHASTADMYHADVADYAYGPADESDWDFGVAGEFGGLAALVES